MRKFYLTILTQGIPVIYSYLPSYKTLLFLNPYLYEATDSTIFQKPLRNHPSFFFNNAPLPFVRTTNKIYATPSKQFSKPLLWLTSYPNRLPCHHVCWPQNPQG